MWGKNRLYTWRNLEEERPLSGPFDTSTAIGPPGPPPGPSSLGPGYHSTRASTAPGNAATLSFQGQPRLLASLTVATSTRHSPCPAARNRSRGRAPLRLLQPPHSDCQTAAWRAPPGSEQCTAGTEQEEAGRRAGRRYLSIYTYLPGKKRGGGEEGRGRGEDRRGKIQGQGSPLSPGLGGRNPSSRSPSPSQKQSPGLHPHLRSSLPSSSPSGPTRIRHLSLTEISSPTVSFSRSSRRRHGYSPPTLPSRTLLELPRQGSGPSPQALMAAARPQVNLLPII